MTQLLKRSPVNLRGLLAIPKTQNPKALALFLSSFLKMTAEELPDREELVRVMIQLIAAKRSAGSDYWCWGYSFAWQTRKEVVPAGTPNLVCTTFVAGALLDAYDQTGDAHCLEMAASAAGYIANDLFWADASGLASFAYPTPTNGARVHNANFLAAALLCRVYRHTREEKLLDRVLKAARSSASKQRQDGSWYYGEEVKQRWIDNFHTGYNLSGLRTIREQTGTREFDASIEEGLAFYKAHFIRDDGVARYFHDRTYPIDIHCVAQTILTLVEFQDAASDNLALAEKVFDWAMRHMWDEGGYFYYRVLRGITIRTSYMRWSQAWMLLAMVSLKRAQQQGTEGAPVQAVSQPA